MTSFCCMKRWCALFLVALLVGCAAGPNYTAQINSPIVANTPLASNTPLNTPLTSNTSLATHLPAFKHIFLIVMENKDYEGVIDEAQAAYMNGLAKQYGLAANYYGITHPSLPNYLALTGGSTFGITSDCTNCTVSQTNLIDQLEAAGKSWKAYMEDMPHPCFIGDSGALYRQKHNPFIYYDNVRNDPARCNKIVPFTEFESDLRANQLPNFVWITPNMEHDTHDSPISTGDTWLKTWVPQILASPAWQDNGVLFITYDEGKGNEGCCQDAAGGHIVTLVISPLGKPAYQSAVAYDHYSLLRTIEKAWNLPELGGAACPCAPPMADFFTEAASIGHS